MSEATITAMLPMLKIDLGITATAYDGRLTQYLNAAVEQIQREGATLDDGVEAQQLVIMYAAWQWRRRDSGEGMPRMVRYALNNFILSKKAKED